MKLASIPLLILASLFLVGCVSVSVKDVKLSNEPRMKPQKIYVADFDTKGTQIKSKGVNDVDKFKQQAVETLSQAITKNVSLYVAPSVRINSMDSLPTSGWLLRGRFTRISQGNKTLRMGVGLGMGGTKMETEVMVSDLATPNTPFLRFGTTGGSNAMPGLLTSTGPTSVVVSVLVQSQTGLKDDAARTSRMIAAALSDYTARRGWGNKNKALKVKKPGEFQIIR